ncbi:ATPase [Streptomyces ruber]|uniref:ATPase n=2 Tax=Streptomyces TaxID=1883 RepID=A0A918EVG3_9ACTN|nr:ATPase [Streptomyces ruber]
MIPPASLGTEAVPDRFAPGTEAGVRPDRGRRSGVRAEAADERRFRFELAAHPSSVARARRLTRARLSGWALCEDTCDTATLVVSELVTNAIVHAAGERVVCELHDGDDRVRIAVRDEGCAPGTALPSPRRPEEEHGRGLLLVEAVCRAWGTQEAGPGLLVWVDLPRGTRDTRAHTVQDTRALVPAQTSRSAHAARPAQAPLHEKPSRTAEHAWPDGARPHPADGTATHTAVRSDLGWSAKKPPTEDRGNGTRTPRETGAEWK